MITGLRQGIKPLLAALIVVTGLGGAAASTQRGTSWDGTWAGGWENREGVQITFVGQKLISFYRGDYRDIERSQIAVDGKTVTFTWAGGEATLQRAGEDDARITLRERGKAERSFVVKRE